MSSVCPSPSILANTTPRTAPSHVLGLPLSLYTRQHHTKDSALPSPSSVLGLHRTAPHRHRTATAPHRTEHRTATAPHRTATATAPGATAHSSSTRCAPKVRMPIDAPSAAPHTNTCSAVSETLNERLPSITDVMTTSTHTSALR
jgi:hypothetical protein